MIDPLVSVLIALCGAVLFGSAAAHKLRPSNSFAATLGEYRILPSALVAAAGLLIGAVEIAVAAGLLWPVTRPMSAAIGSALLLLYAGAIGINLVRGRSDLDCGCGVQPRTIGGWMVIRNLFLAAVLAVVQIPASSRPLGLPDFATIVGGTIIAALLYVSAELLLGRTPPRQLFSLERS
jgi:hypothetical protein